MRPATAIVSRRLMKTVCFLVGQGLYSHDTDNYDVGPDDVQLSDVSHQIQEVGAKLELSYPSLYVDLPRQLSMPLRSQVSYTQRCDAMLVLCLLVVFLGDRL